MTTAIPIEPIFIGGHSVYVKFFVLARNPGDPSRIEGTFTLMGPDGVLTLDGLVGPQGIPGEPSPIIRPQWGYPVDEIDDLPELATLDESDNGRAWYIDGQWHVYSDGMYHVIQGSIPGPPGQTPDISVSAELIDLGSPPVFGPIDVQESGTGMAPNFHIKIPAVPGPEGPATSIELAVDYDDHGTPSEIGDFLMKQTDTEWGPGSPDLLVPKMWTIPEGNFIDHNGSEGRFLIASLNVPGQPYDWYPDVSGHVKIKRNLLSSAQTEIEVRIGDTGIGTGETAPLCGLAPFDPIWALLDATAACDIKPHFSGDGDPLRSVSPDTGVGRVPANQAKTFYVFIHKAGGSGGYTFTKTNAHLRVNIFPVI